MAHFILWDENSASEVEIQPTDTWKSLIEINALKATIFVPTVQSFQEGHRHYVMVSCTSVNLPPNLAQFSKWWTIVRHSYYISCDPSWFSSDTGHHGTDLIRFVRILLHSFWVQLNFFTGSHLFIFSIVFNLNITAKSSHIHTCAFTLNIFSKSFEK